MTIDSLVRAAIAATAVAVTATATAVVVDATATTVSNIVAYNRARKELGISKKKR